MTDVVKKPRTRTTTIYDKLPTGWRYLRTEEVPVVELDPSSILSINGVPDGK